MAARAPRQMSPFNTKVMAEVMSSARDEFASDGLDDSVLQQLQACWKEKMLLAPAAAAARATAPPPPLQLPAAAAAPVPPVALVEAPAGPVASPPAPSVAPAEPVAVLGRALPPVSADAGWFLDADAQEPPEPPGAAVGQKRKEPEQSRAIIPSPAAAPARGGAGPAAGELALATADLGDDDDEKDPETRNLILIQFEKVSHVKNKWKCVFRNGVLNLNGEEHIVATASGAFTF